jgi:2-keto-4-pentenoate hydratase/2-oxohepta-3-ene-1,7-dioic acid hydratase in catechol pathway
MTHWIRFDHAGQQGFGTLQDGMVQPHEGSMFDVATAAGGMLALGDVKLRAPVQPGKVIAMYNNFGALLEKMNVKRPLEPQYLAKPPNTFADPGATIRKPPVDSRIIFEGELAIVIGKRARDVPPARALEHVFGYTCANDVTAVDFLTRDPSFQHWVRAKGFDGFLPLGPIIATGLDPATLVVRSVLNGQVRQEYSVSDMVFGVPQLVHLLSQGVTLDPGDVILAGTSVGVGVMKPGSTIDISIEGIGTLSNRFE